MSAAMAFAASCAAFAEPVAPAAPATPAAPAEAAAKLANLFLTTSPTLYKPEGYRGGKAYGGNWQIHYATVSLWVNALECAHISGDTNLESRLVAAFEPYYSEQSSVMHDYRHVDLAIVGAVPLEIAVLTGDSRALALGLRYAERQWEEPSEAHDWGDRWYDKIPLAERRDWWQKGYTPQTRLWIDDMYMITLLQSQAYRATGDYRYVERAAREMCLYLERLQREDGLFNHAPGAPFAWGRGNGWMAAGMAMNLKFMKPDDPSRPKILSGYAKMMKVLLANQRASGLWGQIIDDAESWDETSGSAMFAYALNEGLRQGLIGATAAGGCESIDTAAAEAAVAKAYAALVARLDKFGNLSDVCAGTGWRNDREHYMKRPRVIGDPHGQAPLLWLCASLMESHGLNRPCAAAVNP